MRSTLAACLLLIAPAACFASDSAEFGSFEGRVVTEWLDDGRKMKLLETFSYVDPRQQRWEAPAGSVIDGASIPRLAWSIIGGPFEGKYRDASVIHDVACDQKARPWQEVHRAFLTAMLASGVAGRKAKIMYGAVYHFGPRWERVVEMVAGSGGWILQQRKLTSQTFKGDRVTVSSPEIATEAPEEAVIRAIYQPPERVLAQEDFDKLVQAIESQDLTLAEIEDFATSGPESGRR